jgi:transcriptional regulator with XRE-family HTH domain
VKHSETLDELLRERTGLTDLRDIAAKVHVSTRALQNLRLGRTAPREATVIALAAALRVSRERVAAAIAASRAAARD